VGAKENDVSRLINALPNCVMNTKQWINFAISETETALALLYTFMKFQMMREQKSHVDVMNRNAEFWMLHNGAVQHTLFIYLGRLSDDTDGKSFADLNRHCFINLKDFSRASFLSRNPKRLKLNPEFLEGKTEPSREDMKRLFAMVKPHNSLLRGVCKTIRSKVFAHAILTEEHQYANLFSQVSLDKIEEALLAYWSISKHLWECFHNARSIHPAPLDYIERDQIFERTQRALYGPPYR